MSNSSDLDTVQSADDQSSEADLGVDTQQSGQSRLSDEDLARVQLYLSSPIHSVERKPFKSIAMILILIGVVVGLGLLSKLIASLVLV